MSTSRRIRLPKRNSRTNIRRKGDRWGKTEYRVRHILVKTQDEAKQIIDQINKGASFAKIAAEKSLDEESKDRGGILDWTSASVFTGQLSSAIMGLKEGRNG